MPTPPPATLSPSANAGRFESAGPRPRAAAGQSAPTSPTTNGERRHTQSSGNGAGLGEHIIHEPLTEEQTRNYHTLELRENMSRAIKIRFPKVQAVTGDCQQRLDQFEAGYFDRILAVHVLEHLPNLPAAIRECYRLCNKEKGVFSVVIPCEGSPAYTLA